jgi:hypothetical protein
MRRKLYQVISSTLQAQENCRKSGNTEWEHKHRDILNALSRLLPNGGGVDGGVKIGIDSKPDRIVLRCSFHHMNETCYYDGWTDHAVIVTPSLAHGFELRITGRNRNQIKDYLADTFDIALKQEVEPDYENEAYRLVA